MHELAICQSILAQAILAQALTVAEFHKSREIGKIRLRIGPLAGVEPDLLKFAFPNVAAGTLGARAELTIETSGVSVECRICGVVSEVPPNRLLCVACGAWRVAVLRGDEMSLDGVELIEPRSRVSADV